MVGFVTPPARFLFFRLLFPARGVPTYAIINLDISGRLCRYATAIERIGRFVGR